MEIRESSENYLETILMEKKRLGKVRSIDICNAMGFSKPTVSVAMKNFREGGYITVDESGYIELTQSGQEIAEKMYERHFLIAKMFIQLGVDEQTAYQDACKIEHDISEETFHAIINHIKK